MGKENKENGTQYATKNKSSYMFFAADKREEVKSKHNITTIGDIGKKLGELWNGMSEDDKKPYEAMAAKDKERYQKEKDSGLETKPRKVKGEKKAGKKKKDPNAPKRPQSAYFLWLNENRAKIIEEHKPEGGVAGVAKKAGELWGKMTDADKKKYVTMAEQKKAEYEKEKEAYDAQQGGEEEEDETDETEE